MPSTPQLDVLYEDNHLLVVNKPAMLPTMGVAASRTSLLSIAKDYVREKYDKPGNVYLGVVSRLDAPVTGVVLLARTSKAASRLTAAFREREVTKKYWAVVSGVPDPSQGDVRTLPAQGRASSQSACHQLSSGRCQNGSAEFHGSVPNKLRLHWSRYNWKQGVNTRFACSSPSWGTPFSAIASMEVPANFRRALRCIPILLR